MKEQAPLSRENNALPTSTGSSSAASGNAGSTDGEPVPAELQNMAESVTRHAQNPNVEDSQFLLCGIDTLDLGLYVQWDENWSRNRILLDEKKQQAQGTTGLLDEKDIGRDFLAFSP